MVIADVYRVNVSFYRVNTLRFKFLRCTSYGFTSRGKCRYKLWEIYCRDKKKAVSLYRHSEESKLVPEAVITYDNGRS